MKKLCRFASFSLALLTLLAALAGCAKASTTSEQPLTPPEPISSSSSEIEGNTEPISISSLDWIYINGATGWASVSMPLRSEANHEAAALKTLAAGDGFTILSEDGDWWRVEADGETGFVPHNYCFVNLPDVVPSIVYDSTNTYASLFVSSGHTIPAITGEALYEGRGYNERLGREEFIMPVLYAMAKKIYNAQRAALSDGNSLKIYEAFRPYSTQMQVANALGTLAEENEEVMAGINSEPWAIHWFIATSTSNHQMGYAIDVSLVKVTALEYHEVGAFSYPLVTAYDEYEMPTKIHELSQAAATFTAPVTVNSQTAWKEATLAPTMNESAVLLQNYCTGAGLSPLASEWWHFNDLTARENIQDNPSNGQYILTTCYSRAPEL